MGHWTYVYDVAGRLTKQTDACGKVTELVNDHLGRVLSRKSGEPLSRPMSMTMLLPVLIWPSGKPTIRWIIGRPRGPGRCQRQRGSPAKAGSGRTMTWDDANRLSKVTNASGVDVLYDYGPDGARAKKTVLSTRTLYPDAGVEIIPTTQKSVGDKVIRYPHPDLMLTSVDGVTTKHYLHRDHLATVRLVTDANGSTGVEGGMMGGKRTCAGDPAAFGSVPAFSACQ